MHGEVLGESGRGVVVSAGAKAFEEPELCMLTPTCWPAFIMQLRGAIAGRHVLPIIRRIRMASRIRRVVVSAAGITAGITVAATTEVDIANDSWSSSKGLPDRVWTPVIMGSVRTILGVVEGGEEEAGIRVIWKALQMSCTRPDQPTNFVIRGIGTCEDSRLLSLGRAFSWSVRLRRHGTDPDT
jgi:hypothetical protein